MEAMKRNSKSKAAQAYELGDSLRELIDTLKDVRGRQEREAKEVQ